MATRLVLSRNRKRRLEQGHPWVFQSEVDRVDGPLEPGDLVDIVNHQGVFLARGYANPRSQIIARILTYDKDEAIDEAFFRRRFEQAAEFRGRFVPDPRFGRAVYGEADFVPGLIVDRYGDVLVVQVLSAGMERLWPMIQPALLEVFEPRGILLRNDVPVRRLEGLDETVRVAWGDVPREIEIVENGLRFLVDPYEGQKTGYFWDQTENRAAIRPLMTGWGARNGRTPSADDPHWDGAEVLECFCHTGSFTVHALHYGARHVTAVDISEEAIAIAKRNVALNGGADRVTFRVGNAFDVLREADDAGARYDVVILDPPAFAKSRAALPGARRGYKEINLRAMRILRDGGFLVTASCSFHMSPELFQETILDAALDAHKILRLVHWAGAGKDHPEIAGVREGHYLKFAIYEVRSRR
jgi:23S rRNA (cytosine1962-C5)-methyltransferase